MHQLRSQTQTRRKTTSTPKRSTAIAAVIVSSLVGLNAPCSCSALRPVAATSPQPGGAMAIGPTNGGGLGVGRLGRSVAPAWGRRRFPLSAATDSSGGDDENGNLGIKPASAASGGDDAARPPPPSAAATEAGRLLERARRIRESIPESRPASSATSVVTSGDVAPVASTTSPRGDDSDGDGDGGGIGYRLYVDIGREAGTWMDPTWGASGARIDLSVDVAFPPPTSPPAPKDVVKNMVKDNFGGRSSPVRALRCTVDRGARLRGGFDSMRCRGGGYRVDVSKTTSTVRFYLDVDGTSEGRDSGYGDVFVPRGCLYFSIPCFGNSVRNLSRKEAPVTVRQVGWHTGWRREESRIVGLCRAVPIDEAKERDGY